jgi:predicted negative regulator of RcsB-dependent stress response
MPFQRPVPAGWPATETPPVLGDAYRSARDRTAARDAYQQALTILTDLDHPDAEKVRTKLNQL